MEEPIPILSLTRSVLTAVSMLPTAFGAPTALAARVTVTLAHGIPMPRIPPSLLTRMGASTAISLSTNTINAGRLIRSPFRSFHLDLGNRKFCGLIPSPNTRGKPRPTSTTLGSHLDRAQGTATCRDTDTLRRSVGRSTPLVLPAALEPEGAGSAAPRRGHLRGHQCTALCPRDGAIAARSECPRRPGPQRRQNGTCQRK